MKPRIFLAGLFHETNTFVEQPTTLDDFFIERGEEILGALGNDSPADGFLQCAQEFGWEVVPGIDYRAQPSGPVEDEAFESFWRELQPSLETALAGGLDAIFLILHGAMATQGIPDAEGELLERIRRVPGAETLPLFAILDMHANVSERMAIHSSALIPYRENPHTDARETAVRGARLLRRALTSRVTPKTHLRHSRVLLAPPSTGTANAPIQPIEAMARNLEREGGHWEVGIAPGFAHADTPDTGMTFWVTSDQPEITCHRALDTLFSQSRMLAREMRPTEWEVNAALDEIARDRKFPALLVEPADNIGGGAPGDATFLLRAFLERPIGKSGVVINDPAAAALLHGHQPGDTVSVSLGGKGSSLDHGPVDLEVTLVRLSDGKFSLEDKQSHMASMRGSAIDMGLSAVVTHKHLTILVTSVATPPMDLGQWRSQGVEPRDLELIGVKAAVAHRRAYDAITGSSYTVSTPGPNSSDLKSLPYRLLRRPIYPLDE